MNLRDFVDQNFDRQPAGQRPAGSSTPATSKPPSFYQFNTQFYQRNPTVLKGVDGIIDAFRQVNHVTIPKDPATGREANVQFALGPAGSGAVMHYHQAAANFLAFGRKRWSLLEPDVALYSDIPARPWVEEYVDGPGCTEPDSLCPSRASNGTRANYHLQCTQHAGDLLILPFGYGPATLNLEASVGFAFEMSFAPVSTAYTYQSLSSFWPPAH